MIVLVANFLLHQFIRLVWSSSHAIRRFLGGTIVIPCPHRAFSLACVRDKIIANHSAVLVNKRTSQSVDTKMLEKSSGHHRTLPHVAKQQMPHEKRIQT